MLVDSQSDRENHIRSIAAAVSISIASIAAAICAHPAFWAGLAVAVGGYFWMRRSVRRRLRVIAKPIDPSIKATLSTMVDFYAALDDDGKTRFENKCKVFLDEVQITGIETEVDDTTRALVAASAVIPIYAFEDWEYSGLGEVLIYPNSFDQDYSREGESERTILGMVGSRHLSGVMILSKPSLIQGFKNKTDRHNVGIHEFAHLVDKQSGDIDGIPPEIPDATVDPWVQWVGDELRRDGSFKDINDYAYTNEAEYFAVLSEYFFENPATLAENHPKLYAMMRKMYHIDPRRVFSGRRKKRRRRARRNDPCPCGSGEKYKRCCRQKRIKKAA